MIMSVLNLYSLIGPHIIPSIEFICCCYPRPTYVVVGSWDEIDNFTPTTDE
jgi:hypothetical protein